MAFDALQVKAVDQLAHHQHGVGGKERLGKKTEMNILQR